MRPNRLALVKSLLPKLALAIGAGDDGTPTPLKLSELFDAKPQNVWLEIGFGAGEHLVAQARANPTIGFIGCDPFFEGVGKLVSQIEAAGLSNIRIFPGDANRLITVLPGVCLGKVFALFPDPWPKKRHHKRRLVNKGFLNSLARTMCDDATFHFSTDHDEYGRWVLRFLLEHQAFDWSAHGPRDWRTRPSDGIITRYEQKALTAGRTCIYLEFRRRPRARHRLENCS